MITYIIINLIKSISLIVNGQNIKTKFSILDGWSILTPISLHVFFPHPFSFPFVRQNLLPSPQSSFSWRRRFELLVIISFEGQTDQSMHLEFRRVVLRNSNLFDMVRFRCHIVLFFYTNLFSFAEIKQNDVRAELQPPVHLFLIIVIPLVALDSIAQREERESDEENEKETHHCKGIR